MFAAIGTDGVREVVWGIGETPADADREAYDEAKENDCDPALVRTVPVTPKQVERIKAGEVSAESLGLACRI